MNELRLIAGSGRSGTTWVLDALADANRLRPIFEPLHPDTSPTAQEYAYRYLSRDRECDRLKLFLAAAASNRLHSVWTSHRIRPAKLRIGSNHFRSPSQMKAVLGKWKELAESRWSFRERERRNGALVKCIRANLMLDWIHATFAARILVLMRHPGAVVESQLRFAEHWDPYHLLEKYKSDADLINGPLRGHSALLHDDLSRPQALTAIWCIENLVPSAQAAANGYAIVFYEKLLERPDVEWQRIAQALGLPAVPELKDRDKPSQQAAVTLESKGPASAGYAQACGSWRERLSGEQLVQIQSMLERFGVDFYVVAEDRPDEQAFRQRFLRRRN